MVISLKREECRAMAKQPKLPPDASEFPDPQSLRSSAGIERLVGFGHPVEAIVSNRPPHQHLARFEHKEKPRRRGAVSCCLESAMARSGPRNLHLSEDREVAAATGGYANEQSGRRRIRESRADRVPPRCGC